MSCKLNVQIFMIYPNVQTLFSTLRPDAKRVMEYVALAAADSLQPGGDIIYMKL